MQITNDDYNDLLNDLLKTLSPQLQPDEITTQIFSKASGYSVNGARVFLDRQVADGLLEKHEAMNGGQLIMAYRKKI